MRDMNRMLQRSAWVICLAIVCLLLLQTAAMACPTCKENLAQNDPAHATLVRGYFWSIIFMMSMPFLILSGLSALFWWEVRKAKLQKLREAETARAAEREPVGA
jgi:heme/copper-type cytochrome/quinol oxidase subunit 2